MSNIEKFKFNPPLGFNDSNAYPDPVDEESVREMMQRQHNQTRDYINRLTSLLEQKFDNPEIATTEKAGAVIVGKNLKITKEGVLESIAEMPESITNTELESMLK